MIQRAMVLEECLQRGGVGHIDPVAATGCDHPAGSVAQGSDDRLTNATVTTDHHGERLCSK